MARINTLGPYTFLQRNVGNSWSEWEWSFDCTRCNFFELHPAESRCRWKPVYRGVGTHCTNRDAQTESLLHLMQQARRELARRWTGTAYVMRVPDTKNAPAILLEDWWEPLAHLQSQS